MNIGNFHIKANWGLIGVTTLLAAASCAFFADAYTTSTNVQNLLLITPATVLVVLLFIIIVAGDVRIERRLTPADNSHADRSSLTLATFRTPALMTSVGLYLVGITYIGFDVSTFAFMVVALAIQGERRPVILLGYSAVFAFLLVTGMKALLPFPVPTLFL